MFFFMRRGIKKCEKREKSGNEHWKRLLMGGLLSVLVAVGLLGICSVLISGGVIPETAGEGCVLISCAFGALAGGRITVKRTKKGALLWGVASGGLMVALLAMAGFLLFDRFEGGRCAAVSGACLCGGGLSGVLGSGGKKKKF